MTQNIEYHHLLYSLHGLPSEYYCEHKQKVKHIENLSEFFRELQNKAKNSQETCVGLMRLQNDLNDSPN